MTDPVTSDRMIESFVAVHFGQSDSRSRHLFQSELQVLVELAKREQRMECEIDMAPDGRCMRRIVVH